MKKLPRVVMFVFLVLGMGLFSCDDLLNVNVNSTVGGTIDLMSEDAISKSSSEFPYGLEGDKLIDPESDEVDEYKDRIVGVDVDEIIATVIYVDVDQVVIQAGTLFEIFEGDSVTLITDYEVPEDWTIGVDSTLNMEDHGGFYSELESLLEGIEPFYVRVTGACNKPGATIRLDIEIDCTFEAEVL